MVVKIKGKCEREPLFFLIGFFRSLKNFSKGLTHILIDLTDTIGYRFIGIGYNFGHCHVSCINNFGHCHVSCINNFDHCHVSCAK